MSWRWRSGIMQVLDPQCSATCHLPCQHKIYSTFFLPFFWFWLNVFSIKHDPVGLRPFYFLRYAVWLQAHNPAVARFWHGKMGYSSGQPYTESCQKRTSKPQEHKKEVGRFHGWRGDNSALQCWGLVLFKDANWLIVCSLQCAIFFDQQTHYILSCTSVPPGLFGRDARFASCRRWNRRGSLVMFRFDMTQP